MTEIKQFPPYPSVSRVMEVTRFKTQEHAEAAIAALRWLDAGAPHEVEGMKGKLSFDMKNYINSGTPQCGTACCIAGAITLHKYKGMYPTDLQSGVWGLRKEFDVDEDNTEDPLTQLFFPQDNEYSISRKTPEQASYTLRKYLFTGEVEWQ